MGMNKKIFMLEIRKTSVSADIRPGKKVSMKTIQNFPGSFFMQITRVIRVTNVRLTQAYPTCTVCAFHSLIAEALRQIDYPVN